MNNQITNKLKKIPHKPGCYLWKNNNGVVIYVGKANDLAKRTKQYFSKQIDIKTKKLVSEIADVDYIVVKNENESLLLENNLISQFKPKYNILLRESNSFPYIVLTKEVHPRILYLHGKSTKIKGNYYGPFANPNIKKYDLYNFLNRIFPLRKCNKLPNKKCVYYDIKQCLGPCIKNITDKDYEPIVNDINDFFMGKIKNIDDQLEKKEKNAASKLMFEDSAKYLELRKNLKQFSLRQDIIFSKKNNEDVIGFHCKENVIVLVIFKYINGILLNKYDLITVFYSEINEILTTLIYDYYFSKAIELPNKVYVSLPENLLKMLSESLPIKFLNPLKGIKKEIIETTLNNAIEIMKQKYLQVISNQVKELNALDELKKVLKINNLNRIELFDNSHLFNYDRVGAMVVYENGIKNKNEYRKFIIKNQQSKSDTDYMYEVIYRRYQKVIENGVIPNLIIVDGGHLQVNAAFKALKKLNLETVIPIIGLAKDDKHKTNKIVFSNLSEFILDKKSHLFYFLLNMQEEVHKFAITFFRQKKSKSLFANSLMTIKNLGKKRIEKLIEKYETIENIKAASIEELSQIVPQQVAHDIKKLK